MVQGILYVNNSFLGVIQHLKNSVLTSYNKSKVHVISFKIEQLILMIHNFFNKEHTHTHTPLGILCVSSKSTRKVCPRDTSLNELHLDQEKHLDLGVLSVELQGPFGWRSGKLEGWKINGRIEKWKDRKYLVFPCVCLVGGMEKQKGGKLFCLVEKKNERIENVIYIN